jgi:molybdenum cofactor biosynthesis enzyme MoaA
VTFVATYHCNFRCEMCNIWQKKSVDEMTPDEVGLFFERWPQFRWVHLTGGELFMRRDLDDLVAAIQKSCKSLFLLNFPTTGWFGDKTVSAGRTDTGPWRRPAHGDDQPRRTQGAP